MNPATMGAIAGFLSALVALGIPVAGFALRVDRRTRKAVRLLTGHEEVEGDGVLPRLRDVEDDVTDIEATLVDTESIEYEQSGAVTPE